MVLMVLIWYVYVRSMHTEIIEACEGMTIFLYFVERFTFISISSLVQMFAFVRRSFAYLLHTLDAGAVIQRI